mmetsp:Transcript_112266/g.281301  ORF Transcript_112266/g.281301 Transcript_112266/m.281301 type:complete len:196 (+) Transcript_112266:57-644(+)
MAVDSRVFHAIVGGWMFLAASLSMLGLILPWWTCETHLLELGARSSRQTLWDAGCGDQLNTWKLDMVRGFAATSGTLGLVAGVTFHASCCARRAAWLLPATVVVSISASSNVLALSMAAEISILPNMEMNAGGVTCMASAGLISLASLALLWVPGIFKLAYDAGGDGTPIIAAGATPPGRAVRNEALVASAAAGP